MIVISGILVLVALALLIAGLVVSASGLALVYASIGVSIVAGVFLFLGVRQRRDEPAAPAGESSAAPAPGGDDDSAVTAVRPAPAPVADEPVDEPADDADGEWAEPDGEDLLLDGEPYVYVVPGRPRYHVEGCRYLAGRDVEERTAEEAREDGYTPCGVCRPDDVLAAYDDQPDLAQPAAAEAEPEPEPEPAVSAVAGPVEDDAPAEDDEPQVRLIHPAERSADAPVTQDEAPGEPAGSGAPEPEPEPEPVAGSEEPAGGERVAEPAADAAATGGTARLRSGRTRSPRTEGAPRTRPARKATGSAQEGAEQPGPPAPEAGRPAPPTRRAPSRTAAASAAAPAAAVRDTAAPRRQASAVVVVPGRGKFHRAECRFVRAVPQTEELTKAAARRQGYEPCGVCKP